MTQEHGTQSAYQKGCRCRACRNAHSEYFRDYRQRRAARAAASAAGTPDFLTAREIAQILRISRMTVSRMIAEGVFPDTARTPTRRFRVPASSFLAYVNSLFEPEPPGFTRLDEIKYVTVQEAATACRLDPSTIARHLDVFAGALKRPSGFIRIPERSLLDYLRAREA